MVHAAPVSGSARLTDIARIYFLMSLNEIFACVDQNRRMKEEKATQLAVRAKGESERDGGEAT